MCGLKVLIDMSVFLHDCQWLSILSRLCDGTSHLTCQQSVCHDKLVQYPWHSMSSSTRSLEETEEQCVSDREVSWWIHDCWLVFNAGDWPSVGQQTWWRIDCLWTSFIPSASFLLNPCDITGFTQVSAQGENFSTRKMIINSLLLTPQSTCHHLMGVSWAFCLIKWELLLCFITLLNLIPLSLRHLPRQWQCTSTSKMVQ